MRKCDFCLIGQFQCLIGKDSFVASLFHADDHITLENSHKESRRRKLSAFSAPIGGVSFWYGGGERSPLYNRPRVNAGYAIFPANRYHRSHTITVDRLAPQKEFESPTFRLGGGRSILLSYWGIYPVLYPNFTQVSTTKGKQGRKTRGKIRFSSLQCVKIRL